MNLSDLRFPECANFYKLKEGYTLTDANIQSMMVEVIKVKKCGYLFNEELIRIVDNYNYGRYKAWLDGNLDKDDNDVFCLYQAVYYIVSYGLYSAMM